MNSVPYALADRTRDLITLCVLCALVTVSAACVPSSPSMNPTASEPARASADALSSFEPTAEPKLGKAPRDCPGTLTQERVGSYGPAYGGDGVWAGVYAELEAPNILHSLDAPLTPDGWRLKVLWIVDPDHPARITLAGSETTRGWPIEFEIGGTSSVKSTSPVLDPDQPSIPLQDEYANFPSYIYLVGSGCYQLGASWEAGGWVLKFAFGT